jgi:DNA repair exonuclease SbcCD ATPase subunit
MTGHTFTRKVTGKSYSYYKCYSKLQKGPMACEGLSIPVDRLEDFVIDQLKQLSKDKQFLSDKKKMLAILQSKRNGDQAKFEMSNIEGRIRDLSSRLETLLSKMERNLISDEDFTPRYTKIKNEISRLSHDRKKLSSLEDSNRMKLKSLEASFQEISSFNNNLEYLDDFGKALRINSIVKEIRVTEEEIFMDIYLDFAKMSRTGTDSWPR